MLGCRGAFSTSPHSPTSDVLLLAAADRLEVTPFAERLQQLSRLKLLMPVSKLEGPVSEGTE